MQRYDTVMFDLDDTLINRDQAIEKMFKIIIEELYRKEEYDLDEMFNEFVLLDNKGYSRKTEVFNTFFNKFSPLNRLNDSEIILFWNSNFPKCFTIEKKTIKLINQIKENYKVAIITNGNSMVQKQKVAKTNLDILFDTIIISDDIGYNKPNSEIFNYALTTLKSQASKTLFVGDNLKNDVEGSKKVGITGVWYNPNKIINNTKIIPDIIIHELDQVIEILKKAIN